MMRWAFAATFYRRYPSSPFVGEVKKIESEAREGS